MAVAVGRRLAHTYSHTLHLPQSGLANRSKASVIAKLLPKTGVQLYQWQDAQRERPVKVLHDGPPYANGELHMGHALNKILKDLINRYYVLAGCRVEYWPGWDCHGLPIELASLKKAKKRPKSAVEKRALARSLALHMVDAQKHSFEQFAVMADWQNPSARYLTLNKDYVVRQLNVFARLFEKGLIFRQRKPVYWSVESGTALAESELQYGEHTSSTAFLQYPLTADLDGISGVGLAVWTTTPWTLPANQAVAVKEDMPYDVVELDSGHRVVVAAALRTAFSEQTGHKIVRVLREGLVGADLAALQYTCPLRGSVHAVVLADHVTDTAGTGLVHTAPGHGKEDFVVGQRAGLPIVSPVDARGKFSSEVEPASLAGLDARKEGTPAVLEMLRAANALLGTSTIVHSVPFDWRSKAPVLVRSTPQFFIDLGAEVSELAMAALDGVSFKPAAGEHRLRAFLTSRTDWCISRQRVWGVPIPVLYERASGEALVTNESVAHIISHIASFDNDSGLERWFADEDDVEAWLPPSLQNRGLGPQYVKGTDTMDVWFDSGSSWTMLDKTPADIYLEGSDQHRGWFQSSLLTHVAMTGRAQAPYKRLITHGFVLDEHRQKMSKSLGNTVEPQQLVKEIGIDGLRLLVAQSDYTSDISLSKTTVSQVASMVKKFRLTFKYLLGNLHDYVPGPQLQQPQLQQQQQPQQPQLETLDLYALQKLNDLVAGAKEAFDAQNFQQVVKLVQTHMNTELSSLYFDTAKDVLYADALHSPRRLAVQYVLWHVLSAYVRLMSPVMPLLTQEVWDECPAQMVRGLASPAMAGFPAAVDLPKQAGDAVKTVKGLLRVRTLVNDAIEQARHDKRVGSSLACDIHVQGLPASTDTELLETLCIASTLQLSQPPQGEWVYRAADGELTVSVVPPSNHKCPRCWKFTAEKEDELCRRCEDAVHG